MNIAGPLNIEDKQNLAVTAFFCGVISLMLGGIVITGWYLESTTLIQIMPQFAPMQYNTALGFVMSGLGLMALVGRISKLQALMGVMVTALGLLTLSQYILDLDFGIDQLFMEYTVMTKTSHPGRMAPNTALCFFLTGLFLINRYIVPSNTYGVIIAEFLGLIVLGLAFMAFWGYVIQIERAFGWADLTRMALHTTIGFLTLGVGMAAHIWRKGNPYKSGVPLWIPFLLFVGALTFDLHTPLGVASGMAYVPLVFCALWFDRLRASFVFAALATALIVAGYYVSPSSDAELQTVLPNRIMSATVIWVTALIIYLQKTTDLRLKASEKQMQAVFENTLDGLIIMNERGNVESFNKACEQIFGYEAGEVIDHNVKMLMPNPYRDKHDGYLDNYKRTQETNVLGTPRELEGQRKDGSVFPIELSANMVELPDKKLFIGILRDITDRKKYEQNLQRTLGALEKANQELEKFAYVASHDLKAPLRGIDNLAGWVAEDIENIADDETKDRMNMLRSRVKRLEAMLKDILEYSRAGRSVEDAHTQEIRQLLKDLLDGIEIPENFAIHIPTSVLEITSPRTPLEQVFLNLLTNAIKHHDRDYGDIDVTWQDTGNMIEFCVEDDGPGIPTQFQDKVFEMFQTLKPRDQTEGTGLGMSIIKKLIEWHGGRVWIESKDGQRGTRIKFTWPKYYEKKEEEDEQQQ